ncbi:MAG TPA: homoserine dehydrogenase [Candidatus Dormibacteraeota bacterium]|jgi:homoserine dehydrogenase|nr:homoserine dehydrogenase [Candidatus Dormibacteraeota bacterium]
MPSYNLALVGFGHVGRAFLRLLIAKETELRRKYDIRWRLTGVGTRRVGWMAEPDGFNPIAILNDHWPAPTASVLQPRNVREWLERSKADVFFEASSLAVQTGQPAIEHLKTALESGAHAISANKGPIVHAYRELSALAREKGRQFLFESTVMDGVPIFSLFPLGLPATELRGFSGVLNSTTNVVLTEIEKGKTFDDAVKRAQSLGIAETDPSADLDGWDAAVKLTALAIVLMGADVKIEQVKRTGIRELSEEKIRSVRTAGMRYKLVCRAERRGDAVQCSVQPELLLATDPLACLEGTSSAIRFDLDMFGLSLVEQNPGIEATAYGLLADFVRVATAG